MQIVGVELRVTGMKLTRNEVREAKTHPGELFVDSGTAYLCGGPRPGEWPGHGHVLPALYDARLTRLRGDSFVIVGLYRRDCIHVHADSPQAWWCQLPAPANV